LQVVTVPSNRQETGTIFRATLGFSVKLSRAEPDRSRRFLRDAVSARRHG
jgi:hypothetical protein